MASVLYLTSYISDQRCPDLPSSQKYMAELDAGVAFLTFLASVPCLTSDQSCLNLTSSQKYIVELERRMPCQYRTPRPSVAIVRFRSSGATLRAERIHLGKVSMPKLKRHQRKYLFEVAPLAFARGQ